MRQLLNLCKFNLRLWLTVPVVLWLNTLHAETITVGILTNSGVQRTVYTGFVQEFERTNPGIQVRLDFKSDAEFKEALLDWFRTGNGPEVINWQGGERLYQYVRQGYIANLDEVWRQNNFDSTFSPGAIGAVSLNGERYAVPISYYQWGFYYRESLFKKLNLSPPTNWEEFLFICQQLKANNIVPITVGAKFKWPTAAWFDYLNLRTNGLEFHQNLLQGQIPFTDERVVNVMSKWKTLLDNGYFVTQYNKWKWDQAMPFLYHKMAGMTLMGNFFAGTMPPFIKEDFRFFRFPIIDPKVAVYEEAPLDLFMIPSYAKDSKAAKTFVAAVANADFQAEFNEKMGMIAPNMSTARSDDYFIQQGAEILNQARGLSQFFDRDTNGEMAGAATEIFTRFMDNRDIQSTLRELEAARQQHLL